MVFLLVVLVLHTLRWPTISITESSAGQVGKQLSAVNRPAVCELTIQEIEELRLRARHQQQLSVQRCIWLLAQILQKE